MAWQSDILKYGLVVGAVGVGGYYLVTRIRSALGAPADAVSAAAEQAGESIGAAGEALGAAAEGVGEAIGGVPEAVGGWAGNLAACPFCNGLPNLLGTPCEKCSELQQQNLPADSGLVKSQDMTPQSTSVAENYIVEWPSGQLADVRLTSEAADYYRDTPGVKVTKSDIIGDINAWFRSDPLGLQQAGDNIQTWALGGASSFTKWVFPSSAPEQPVVNGQSFDLNTGFEVAETGVNAANAQGSLNVGNNALNTSAAPTNQTQETINSVSGDSTRTNLIHNSSNANFGSSTVVNTSSPSVTESNIANTQFMSSSTGAVVAPHITISQGSSGGSPSSGTGGSSSTGSGASRGQSATSGVGASSGSSSAGGSTTSSSSSTGGSGTTSGSTSSTSSSSTASSGNTSSNSTSSSTRGSSRYN